MSDPDDITKARQILTGEAIFHLVASAVPLPRASIFLVPDSVEFGTEAYESIADQVNQPKWQNAALARLFEYGIIARQRINRSKVHYAPTERTHWFQGGCVSPAEPKNAQRYLDLLYWAVTGHREPPPCEPHHYELDPPSDADDPPDVMGVGSGSAEDVVEERAGDEVAEEDTFEYLVAQTLNTIRKRLQKVEDRLTQQQRSLDNMLSTSRKLTELLESQQERSEAGAQRTALVIEAVEKIERAARVLSKAAADAETRSLFTLASRFQAMIEEGQALQSLLFDSMSQLSQRDETEKE